MNGRQIPCACAAQPDIFLLSLGRIVCCDWGVFRLHWVACGVLIWVRLIHDSDAGLQDDLSVFLFLSAVLQRVSCSLFSLLIGCKQIDDWLFFFYHQVVVSAVIGAFFFCNAREQNTPSKRIPRKRPFKFILQVTLQKPETNPESKQTSSIKIPCKYHKHSPFSQSIFARSNTPHITHSPVIFEKAVQLNEKGGFLSEIRPAYDVLATVRLIR